MPQAVWTGSLGFGLVSIPVKLYNATSPKDVRFRQFQAGTGRPIRHRRVVEEELEPGPAATVAEPEAAPGPAATTQAEVAYDDVVKGYQVEPERFVMIEPRELEDLAPERTHTIDVAEFVDLADIDPVYFEKSYHVAPGPGGERPYWLLHRAMREAGRVAVATFVMRTREYLAAVRPGDDVLFLETLYYTDEVRDPPGLGMAGSTEPSAREMNMAMRLIDSLASEWDPSRYRDRYRERVLDLIASRTGAAIPTAPELAEEPEGPRVPDLMAALQASLDAIKEKQPAKAPGKRRRTG